MRLLSLGTPCAKSALELPYKGNVSKRYNMSSSLLQNVKLKNRANLPTVMLFYSDSVERRLEIDVPVIGGLRRTRLEFALILISVDAQILIKSFGLVAVQVGRMHVTRIQIRRGLLSAH